MCFFFFFQAEDGIRDLTVTGVQTCALPILSPPGAPRRAAAATARRHGGRSTPLRSFSACPASAPGRRQIGRGAGRGRGEISGGGGSFKKKKKKKVVEEM